MTGQAYGYVVLSGQASAETATQLRWALTRRARQADLELHGIFVDRLGETPYALATMRELIRRRAQTSARTRTDTGVDTAIRAVILPGRAHLAAIPALAGLDDDGLARQLGAPVLLADPDPLTQPLARDDEARARLHPRRPPAIGLAQVPADAPLTDRHWARGLVVRHARTHRLHLLEVLDTDTTHDETDLLTQLTDAAHRTQATVLLTYGVPDHLADELAAHLGVRHLPVPHIPRPDRAR